MDKQELLIALKQTDPTTNLHNVWGKHAYIDKTGMASSRRDRHRVHAKDAIILLDKLLAL
jgi:hypothetical protein